MERGKNYMDQISVGLITNYTKQHQISVCLGFNEFGTHQTTPIIWNYTAEQHLTFVLSLIPLNTLKNAIYLFVSVSLKMKIAMESRQNTKKTVECIGDDSSHQDLHITKISDKAYFPGKFLSVCSKNGPSGLMLLTYR